MYALITIIDNIIIVIDREWIKHHFPQNTPVKPMSPSGWFTQFGNTTQTRLVWVLECDEHHVLRWCEECLV